MTLANPKALILASLAVPIVLLYLGRARARRQIVATGFLWERVFAVPQRRSRWWPYRHPASLCAQLAILALLVFALAEPHVRAPARLVLLIDNSASMNATDVAPTRLDRAKQLAGEHVASLGSRDEMAILTAGGAVRTACGLTGRREALEEAVAAVAPGTGGTRVADAVAAARQLLRGRPNGRIVVLSDGCFDRAAELARREDVELVAIGGHGDNVAITRLEARRSGVDPDQCEVFVEVSSFAGEPVECRIALAVDGKPIEAVPVALAAEGRWRRVFGITAAEPGRLVARLDRPDVLRADNRASATVPPSGTAESSGRGHVESRAPAAESDVRVPAGFASRAAGPVRARAGPAIWRLLAAAALVLVGIEWHLFQRRWLC